MSLEEQIHNLTITVEKLTDVILSHMEKELNPLVNVVGDSDDLDDIAEPHEESPIPDEVQSTDSKTMELINLSKRMGYPYLMQDGKLIVDNEVLNTYSRQGNKDEV